jgi:hypothetical protein
MGQPVNALHGTERWDPNFYRATRTKKAQLFQKVTNSGFELGI